VIVSSGIPAVLVTHDIDEADEVGDVVIGYTEGRVTGQRTIEQPRATEPDGGSSENTEPS
jgi:ABC-type proline/glycine betaine transport system ATPase subunit